MKLTNISKHSVVCLDCKIASSLRDKYLGLLLKDNPRNLVFFTRWGIHTFFLKHPIDILLLDRDWNVVALKKSLKPFRFYLYDPRFFILIELESGSISRSGTQLGDKIFFA